MKHVGFLIVVTGLPHPDQNANYVLLNYFNYDISIHIECIATHRDLNHCGKFRISMTNNIILIAPLHSIYLVEFYRKLFVLKCNNSSLKQISVTNGGILIGFCHPDQNVFVQFQHLFNKWIYHPDRNVIVSLSLIQIGMSLSSFQLMLW